MSRSLGKAKYGGNSRKYFKLKDGDSVFRILPPIESDESEESRWSVFYNIHYGYTNAAGKNRPFQSPLVKNRKTKMVEVADAALERIETLKGELEKAKKEGKKQVVDGLLKYVGGPKSKYNLDSNHYMNVMDLQGNIGVLKIRHRAKTALQATIDQLREQDGVDPLSAENGRYLVFRRTGNALDTSFQVTVYKEKIEVAGVGKVEKDVVSVIESGSALEKRVLKEAADLTKLFRSPSEEEVRRIVSESDLSTGASPNIDEILGIEGAAAAADEGDTDAEESEQQSASSAKTETKTEVKADSKVKEKIEEKVAEKEEKKETKKTAAKIEASSATQTTATKVSDMSEKDFLASIGLK